MRDLTILLSLIVLLMLGYCHTKTYENLILDDKQYTADLETGKGIFKYCDAEHANTGWDLGRVIELHERCLKIVEEFTKHRVRSTTQK